MTNVQRIPPNLFGIPFGLAGLAGAWSAMAAVGHAPGIVGTVLLLTAAVAWLIVGFLYLRSAMRRRALVDELTDPVTAPFISLALVVPMILGAGLVYPRSPGLGIAVVDVSIAAAIALGGWFIGQWVYADLSVDSLHPGYYLPTVAGGLVASASAAHVGQPTLAMATFGLGLVCWMILGSLTLGRLLFRPALPTPLIPTLAIEVAPPAVASLAWFAMNGGRIDTMATILAGYGALMVVVQIRLLPVFARLPFMPSTWAFTFSWAAVASTIIQWLHVKGSGPGAAVAQYLALAAITLLIGGIAIKTITRVAAGKFLPAAPVPAEQN